MGTNYYIQTKPCAHCGRSDEPVHIGKSSGGWHFALHIYPDAGINSLDDWRPRLALEPIVDEYGSEVSYADMLAIITQRKSRAKINWSQTTLDDNHAEAGLNGLLRHRIESSGNARQSFTNGCVAHGEGTWDCIVGEFS